MKDMWVSVRMGRKEFWLIKPSDKEQGKKTDLAFSTFIVKNIKTEVANLKKKGAKFDAPETGEWTAKADDPIAYDPVGAAAFLKDSEGNLLMLFQSA